MKKTLSFIAFFAVLIFIASSFTGKVVDATVGYVAPSFVLENEDSTINVGDINEKYLLLTFWASSDARSRISCREYMELAQDRESQDVNHIAVNFDRSKRLFEEIIKRDGLCAKTQFYVQGDNAERLKNIYHLDKGFVTLLIDKQGKVIAKNPSKETLKQLM